MGIDDETFGAGEGKGDSESFLKLRNLAERSVSGGNVLGVVSLGLVKR